MTSPKEKADRGVPYRILGRTGEKVPAIGLVGIAASGICHTGTDSAITDSFDAEAE